MAANRVLLGLARGVCCGATLAVLLFGLWTPRASAGVASPSWQQPVQVDASALTHVACPSTSLCVAVDEAGNLVTSVDPRGGAAAWTVTPLGNSAAERCGQGCSINALSCPSESFCAAADNQGDVFTSTDPQAGPGTWRATKVPKLGFFGFTALSCPSTSLCVGVNYTGLAISSTHPTAGTGAWSVQTIDTSGCPQKVCVGYGPNAGVGQLDAIACPSESLCVAADMHGNVLVSTDPTGGQEHWIQAYVDSDGTALPIETDVQAPIESVACASVSLCVASDRPGNVVSSQNFTGGASAWTSSLAAPKFEAAPEPSALSDLSCPSLSFCVGVHADGEAELAPPGEAEGPPEVALTHEPLAGKPWTLAPVGPAASGLAVSCTSPSFCVAANSDGDIIVGLLPSASELRARLRGALTAPAQPTGTVTMAHSTHLSLSFNALPAGSLRIRWVLAGHRKLLIARAGVSVTKPGATPLQLTLTRAGVALLNHRKHLQIAASATFTAPSQRPVTATARLALRR